MKANVLCNNCMREWSRCEGTCPVTSIRREEKPFESQAELDSLVKAIKPELKARLSLLDSDFLMEMAKVGDFGTRKYAEEDWRDNTNVTVKNRLDSLLRHAAKFQSSDYLDTDDETGISHLAHVAFNAMMIWWISENRRGRDNRWSRK